MATKSLYPKILLPINGEQHFVRKEEIAFLEAKGSYTDVYLGDGRQTRISKKLKSAMEILGTEWFVRIHHSYSVNLSFVESLRNGENASIQLSNGMTLPLSRSRKAAFLKFFQRL
ncbi:MAG: LytTR family DNA-binding domain-containing protein [Saprospiraceae bacterium]|nr:LytTR family transcriptional regulator [Lewinella sp.]